jgi:Electron transfer DM13
MRKLLAVGLISGIVGFGLGAAFWYLASPLWINVEVSEALAEASQAAVLAQGTFRDTDTVHRGSGTASVYRGEGGELTLRLTDFTVTNGPDLKVWLVEAGNVMRSEDVRASGYLALGPLKGNIGDQNYDIPAGTDVSGFGSVAIWCEQFSVLFSAADLSPAG